MRILSRTYPQPDSGAPNIGPRERALAVFKYLLDIEPEVAIKHARFLYVEELYKSFAKEPHYCAEAVFYVLNLTMDSHRLKACIVHSFEQAQRQRAGLPLEESLVPMLRTQTGLDGRTIEPMQGEKL